MNRRPVESLEQRILLSSWYVSSSAGSNANAGTFDQPFQTIQAAANVAQPGDTVFIRGGVYRETVVPPRSGTSTQPITFQPYHGERVVIDGADPIGNFSSYRGSIYQANVSWSLGDGQNQLFFDGQMMNEARWPNTSLDVSHPSFSTTTWGVAQLQSSGPSTATIGVPLNDPAGAWVGATIHISPGPGWVVQTGTVIASTPGSLTYLYQPATPEEVPSAGNQFYLTGLFRTLDTSGEWYLDNGGKLYFWTPQNANAAGHDVELKHRQYAFDLSGRSNIDIAGLGIFGCTINTDASSSNNTIQNITARYVSHATINAVPWNAQYHPHTSGIILNGTNNVLKDSTIDFSSGDGVFLGGSNNTVQNSVIQNVDYAGGDEAGVSTLGSNDRVIGNTISNAARSGIVIRFSPGDQVLHNVVHDVGLQLTDLGGIYTWGTDGQGAEIAYNQVYNIHTGGYGAAGIYLDNYSANYVVDHNVVWNCDYALKVNPPSTGDLIYNNTLVGSQYSVASSGSQQMSGCVFANNIFTAQVQIGSDAAQTHNLYAPPGPQFLNPSSGNFELQATSPAIDAGRVLVPYTNGYVGSAPDLGAYEYGAAAFSAGSSVPPPAPLGNMLDAPAQPPPAQQTGSGSASGGQTGSTSGGSQGGTKEAGKPPVTDPTPPPAPPPATDPGNPTTGSGSAPPSTGSSQSAPSGQSSGTPDPTPAAPAPSAAATQVVLSSSENPALRGDVIRFTARVVAPTAPAGSVWFYDGSTLIGTASVGPAGSASIPCDSLPSGEDSITAAFKPDVGQAALEGSVSAPLVETVSDPQPNQPDVAAAIIGRTQNGSTFPAGSVRTAGSHVKVRLTNRGTGPTNGPVKIDLYLSTDDSLDNGDVFIASLARNFKLRPNQTRTVSIPVGQIPALNASVGSSSGSYFLLAQISGLGSPSRVANSASPLVAASLGAQLVGGFARGIPAVTHRGVPFVIPVVIRNEGPTRAKGKLPIVLSLSAAGGSNASPIIVASKLRRIDLAPGRSVTFPVRYVVPAATPAGSYEFVLQLDPSNILNASPPLTSAVSSTSTNVR